ncbi:MAG: ABC transporter substrate-binding protein [Marinosulfonomonas sp.]|nr:ABC transporter substrate-binding protein [Marinosulfonomonas sp.]
MNRLTSRRGFITGTAACLALVATPALAFSTSQAKALIGAAVKDINAIINSGASESVMLRKFENVFTNYADVERIGQLVLGPDGRSASAGQKRAFEKAFKTYISRKYGRRFREFIGGRVEVNSAKAVKSYYEVKTTAHLQGESPFSVVFVVADANGRFIDMKIEGISLIKAERSEIGAMLDKRKGNLDKLIADLKTMG